MLQFLTNPTMFFWIFDVNGKRALTILLVIRCSRSNFESFDII